MAASDRFPAALGRLMARAHLADPYASPAVLRGWDLLLRNAVADALEAVAARWRGYAQEALRSLQVPSRDHPDADTGQLDRLRDLRRMAAMASDLAAAVRAQPLPASDGIWKRLRDGGGLLETLMLCDGQLALAAEALADLAEAAPLADEPARRERLAAVLAGLERNLRERQAFLAPPIP